MAARSRVGSPSRTARAAVVQGSMRDLKAERLDLDAATAVVRSLSGPQAEWPDEAQLSLDIAAAISAGQELRPLQAKLGYGPKTISLDRLKIGEPDRRHDGGHGSVRSRQRDRQAGAERKCGIDRPN